MKYTSRTAQLFFSIIMITVGSLTVTAQTNYRFGTTSGTGGASGSGYTVTDQKVTFTNATTSAFGTTQVTVSLSNQQYGNATANPFEGMTAATYTGAVAFGTAGNTVGVNTAPGSFLRYANLNYFGSPSSSHFTVNKMAVPGTGVPLSTGALSIGLFTDALINSAGENINGVADLEKEIHFADITLTFTEPVSNPVIHFGGLGATTDQSIAGDTLRSWLGYTPVFHLLNAYPVKRLSGSAYFDVDTITQKTRNTAPWMGVNSTIPQCYGGVNTYGVSGSFLVNVFNVTALSFRIYLRSDAGRVTNNFISAPCDGTTTNYPFTTTAYPRWSGTSIVRADGFTLSVSFARVQITGNVFNDPDGGYVNNSTGVVNNIPAGLFANLVDSASGLVLKSVMVNTNGSYDLGEHNAGHYKVIVSSNAGSIGFTPPALILPEGWVSTGAFTGIPNTGNTGNINGISKNFTATEAANIVNINFGIQQLPQSDNHTTTIPQPGVNDTLVLNGQPSHPPLLSGSDVQDGTYTGNTGTVRNPSGIIITSLPTKGILYYNGNMVSAGDTINNPALLTIVLTGTGYKQLQFEYAYLDAAGFADPVPAVYTLNWSVLLPVTFASFQVEQKNKNVLLNWSTASEQYNKGFLVQHSTDGNAWQTLEFIHSLAINGYNNTLLSYHFTHDKPFEGANYYRLQQIDTDGNTRYSEVKMVNYRTEAKIIVFPNPFVQTITVKNINKNEIIHIYNNLGQRVQTIVAGGNTCIIPVQQLSAGIYFLTVCNPDGLQLTNEKLLKK